MEESLQKYLQDHSNNWKYFNIYVIGMILSEYFKSISGILFFSIIWVLKILIIFFLFFVRAPGNGENALIFA